ncbi:MAG: Holliday junction branch migration protein RuvA [bacterium]|jgi:Holliday junction DNA helicase RuvA|nr:Holliday junction branch migration protein RuvA [Candidatus Aquidulcis sp.]
MYAHIRGSVLWVEDDAVVISAGGIGLRVRTLPSVLQEVGEGETVELFLHHIVREDSESLVGFPTRDQARLFATLLDVTGVGPKVAIALLATHGPDLLRRALVDGDEALIARAPGVGKRLAARIIVELADKMSAEAQRGSERTSGGEDDRDLQGALRSLGFPAREAKELASAVAADADLRRAPLADRLRAALRERA